MNTSAFDAFTRRTAAGVSRRASFLALGGAALAAVATPPAIGEAANKKAKKQAEKKCKKEVNQCRAFVTQECAKESDSAATCEAQAQPCCNAFAKCKASAALNCLAMVGT